MSDHDHNEWAEWRQYVLSELKRISKESANTHKHLALYNETLIRNTASLEEHVKRTNILEGKVSHIDTHVKKIEALSWLFSNDNLFLKVLAAGLIGAGAYLIKAYL